MAITSTLLSFVLLAVTVTTLAKPVGNTRDSFVSSALFHRFDVNNIAANDQKRVRDLATNLDGHLRGLSLAKDDGFGFYTTIQIGNPSQNFDMVIDTGSAFSFVGANITYNPSNSSTPFPANFSLQYGSGTAKGSMSNDTLCFGNGLTIEGQVIGNASEAKLQYLHDGILGLGPTDLNTALYNSSTGETIPTILDSLYQQGQIASPVFGISFSPLNLSSNEPTGQISWGRCDSRKYTGELITVDITKADNARHFWAIDQEITYGSNATSIVSTTSGILDTGSSLTMLEQDAFTKYQQQVGAIYDSHQQLLKIPKGNFSQLEDLVFKIANATFVYPPAAQVFAPETNKLLDPTDKYHYLTIGSFPQNGNPQGVHFVNGYYFMQRFYTCYDAENKQIKIANTTHFLDSNH